MKYITVHDGYDVNYHLEITDSSNKQWPIIYWNQLVSHMKESYPNIDIIQLGTKTGRPIAGVDNCLLNKTTITGCFDILAESSLHIDCDSGLVHAASKLGVTCIVLFGPTPDYFYGYKQNKNLRSNHCSEACYWITGDWMNRCPIGHKTPKCMDEITPETVINEVTRILG